MPGRTPRLRDARLVEDRARAPTQFKIVGVVRNRRLGIQEIDGLHCEDFYRCFAGSWCFAGSRLCSIPRELAAASATMISRSCSCLRTSIFAHRSADRSNASAYSKARQQDIVSPALLARQPAGEQQCKRRKPPTEFASPSHTPRANVTFHQNTALTSVASLPNLVTTGQNLGQIRPDRTGSSGNPERNLSIGRNAGSVAIP